MNAGRDWWEEEDAGFAVVLDTMVHTEEHSLIGCQLKCSWHQWIESHQLALEVRSSHCSVWFVLEPSILLRRIAPFRHTESRRVHSDSTPQDHSH